MKNTWIRAVIGAVLVLAVFTVLVPEAQAADTFGGNMWTTIGDAWDSIMFWDSYLPGSPTSRIVDAIITFLLVFMTVYGITQQGRRKMPKSVGVGLGLLLWLPLVIYLNSSGTALLFNPYAIAGSMVIMIGVVYRLFIGIIGTMFGSDRGKEWQYKLLCGLAAIVVVFGFMLPATEIAQANSPTEKTVLDSMHSFYLTAKPLLILLIILLLLTGIGGGVAAYRSGTLGFGGGSSDGRRARHDLRNLRDIERLDQRAQKDLETIWRRQQHKARNIGDLVEKYMKGVTQREQADLEDQKVVTNLRTHLEAVEKFVKDLVKRLQGIRDVLGPGNSPTGQTAKSLNEHAGQYKSLFDRDIEVLAKLAKQMNEQKGDMPEIVAEERAIMENYGEEGAKNIKSKEDSEEDQLKEIDEAFGKNRMFLLTATANSVKILNDLNGDWTVKVGGASGEQRAGRIGHEQIAQWLNLQDTGVVIKQIQQEIQKEVKIIDDVKAVEDARKKIRENLVQIEQENTRLQDASSKIEQLEGQLKTDFESVRDELGDAMVSVDMTKASSASSDTSKIVKETIELANIFGERAIVRERKRKALALIQALEPTHEKGLETVVRDGSADLHLVRAFSSLLKDLEFYGGNLTQLKELLERSSTDAKAYFQRIKGELQAKQRNLGSPYENEPTDFSHIANFRNQLAANIGRLISDGDAGFERTVERAAEEAAMAGRP